MQTKVAPCSHKGAFGCPTVLRVMPVLHSLLEHVAHGNRLTWTGTAHCAFQQIRLKRSMLEDRSVRFVLVSPSVARLWGFWKAGLGCPLQLYFCRSRPALQDAVIPPSTR